MQRILYPFLLLALILPASDLHAAPLRSKKPQARESVPVSSGGPIDPLSTTFYRPLPAPLKMTVVYPDLTHKPWWLFIGFDLGMISYSSIAPGIEATRNGFSGGGRALVSRKFEDFVLDGGFGLQYNAASGVNTDTKKVSTNARMAVLDFSARYRIGPKFQIGPEFNYWLGTDNGLNLDPLSAVDTNNAKLLGVEGVYEWDRMRKYRMGARWLMNIAAPARGLNQVQLFFQIGFDAFSDEHEQAPLVQKHYEQVSASDLEKAESLQPKDRIPLKESEPPPVESAPAESAPAEPSAPVPLEPAPDVMSTPAPPPGESSSGVSSEAAPSAASSFTSADTIPEPAADPVPAAAVVAPKPSKSRKDGKLVITMGFDELPFEYNDTDLPIPNQGRIRNIGRYLAKNNRAWRSIVVSGHTDKRGSSKFNQDISLRRAETVRRLLIEGGVFASRITAVGVGETKPIDTGDTEKAYARNRRVEFEFTKVTDPSVIKTAFDQ
ncbi:MAG: hypothetical protein EBX52_00435 [Proteobacteria bacterium]|nr:hypothetical protein [Pseudomonadota bacterium]